MTAQRQQKQQLARDVESHDSDMTEDELIAKAKASGGQKASDDTDDVLAGIDEALKGVEETLGMTFRQKGGQ